MLSSAHRLRFLGICLQLAAALASGCLQDEASGTRLLIEVTAEATLRERLTRVDVETYDLETRDASGNPVLLGTQPFELKTSKNPKGVTFPFSFGAVKNKADQFLLVVTGFEGDLPVVDHKSRASFTAGQVRKLSVQLADACYQKICAERSTSAWFQSSCDSMLGTCSSVVMSETVVIDDGTDIDVKPDGSEDGSVSEAGATTVVSDGGPSAPVSRVDGGMDAAVVSVPSDAGAMDANGSPGDATSPALDSGSAQDSGVKDTGVSSDAQTTGANDCRPTSCTAPSTCVDGDNDFSCACATGYSALPGGKTCLPHFISISAGGTESCARRTDGSVVCWGRNAYGQFGNGTEEQANAPLVIPALAGVAEIAIGENFLCARRTNGTVACSGFNSSGQLGNGSTSSSPTLVEVSGLSNIVEIAAGYEHACARRMNGTVACWGANGRGQLGNGTMSSTGTSTPVDVMGLLNAVEIAGGGSHSCARRSDNTVVCWGSNTSKQTGDARDVLNTPTFVQVTPLTDAAGLGLGEWHSCARRSGGLVGCWGSNINGELGNIQAMSESVAPATATNLTSVGEIAVNRFYSCARTNDGAVSCWGAWPARSASTPVAIAGVTGAVELAAGWFHTCARKGDGSIVCWGENSYGQMGRGTATGIDDHTPVSAGAVKAY